MDTCYDKYVAISALRHYFPNLFTEFEGREGHLSIHEGKDVPAFLRHYGTTWLIISETKEAFVMDCGSTRILQQIQQLQADGEISDVTQFWLTHYHDDHVDAVPQFQAVYPCKTLTDRVVAQVVEKPQRFRIPCISPSVARIHQRTRDGRIVAMERVPDDRLPLSRSDVLSRRITGRRERDALVFRRGFVYNGGN